MTTLVLVVASLVLQRLLGMPGMPAWTAEVWLPMVFVVAWPLRAEKERWVFHAVALGLAWDVVMEPIVGPGGIAWSAAHLGIGALAGVVAGRRPRMWVGLGALGTLVVVAMRTLVLLPLGVAEVPSLVGVARASLLTGLWCGLVGWLLAAQLPQRWQRYRSRRLR